MQPAAVAIDLQALQGGSGSDPDRMAQVAGLATRLARAGRLAAGLLAPELPAPKAEALPEELSGVRAALLRWDHRGEARRLLGRHPGLLHLVPAPLLHAEVGAPGGMVVSAHWADAGVARAVVVDRVDGEALAAAPRESRLVARLEWIRDADVIVVEEVAETDLVAVLGLDPARTVGRRQWLDGLASTPASPPLNPLAYPKTDPTTRLATRLALYGPLPPQGGGIGNYNARFLAAAASGPGGPAVDAVSTQVVDWPPPPGVGLIHAEAFGTDVRPASYDAVIYTLGNSDGHLPTVEAALRHPGWLWLHEARLPAIATSALAEVEEEVFEERLRRLLDQAYPGRSPWAAARAAGRSHLALARAGVGLTAPLVSRAAGVFVNSNAARASLILDQPPLATLPPVVVLPPAFPPLRPERRGVPNGPPVAVAFGVVAMGKRPDLLVDAAALTGCRLAFVGPCPAILEQVVRDRAAARRVADRVEVIGEVDEASWWEWMDRATVAVQMRDSAGGEMSAAVLDAFSAGVPVITNMASARDYAEGTVEILDPNPEADAVAERLGGLLADAERRRRLSAGAQGYAAAHQMADLVAAVCRAVEEAPH